FLSPSPTAASPYLFGFSRPLSVSSLFFFTDTAPTDIYTLSLHDALPIFSASMNGIRYATAFFITRALFTTCGRNIFPEPNKSARDRKSTRLNSSHRTISYAVFCLKKKKDTTHTTPHKDKHGLRQLRNLQS